MWISSGVPQAVVSVSESTTFCMVRISRKVTAVKAPSMKSAPWAKFTTPSVPKISVRPRAMSA